MLTINALTAARELLIPMFNTLVTKSVRFTESPSACKYWLSVVSCLCRPTNVYSVQGLSPGSPGMLHAPEKIKQLPVR